MTDLKEYPSLAHISQMKKKRDFFQQYFLQADADMVR